jgi:hypothetical protein
MFSSSKSSLAWPIPRRWAKALPRAARKAKSDRNDRNTLVSVVWRVIVAELAVLFAIAGVLYARGRPLELTSASNIVVSTIASPRCDDRHCLASIVFDDADGHIYAIDGESQQIVRISDSGEEVPIAGAYYDVEGPKFEGACVRRDGHGLAARFCNASGLAFDPITKSLIVADTDNFAVRRVTTSGDVTTIAAGDTLQCRHFLYSEIHVCRVTAVAVDPRTSDIYLVQGNAVMRVDREARVRVVAGADPIGWDLSGCEGSEGRRDSAAFCYLAGLTISSHGSTIFATEGMGDVVDRVMPDGEATTFTGQRRVYTGSAAASFTPPLPWLLAYLTFRPCPMRDGSRDVAAFCEPSHLTMDDRTQTLYVADIRSIRTVDSSGNVATVIAPVYSEDCASIDGKGEEARICNPQSLAIDSDHRLLYVLDRGSGIRRMAIP